MGHRAAVLRCDQRKPEDVARLFDQTHRKNAMDGIFQQTVGLVADGGSMQNQGQGA